MFQGLLIGALAMIIPLFITCYGFLQKFATKGELTALESRIEKHANEARSATAETEKRLASDLFQNRESNAHRFGELGSKIDGLNSSVQMFANETSRVVGVLEGKQSMLEKLLEKSEPKSHAR